MNRASRRSRGERGSGRVQAQTETDVRKFSLRDMRFETRETSNTFFELRYLDDAWLGAGSGGVRLPPNDQSVSTSASSGGMVYKAFPHGLMYGDQMSLMAGMGLFLGLMILFFALFDRIFGTFNPFVEFFADFAANGIFTTIVNIVLLLTMLPPVPI